MAEKIIAASIQVKSDQAVDSVKSFKTQLREANQELIQTSEKFGATSAEAVAAAKKVAQFRDAMGDAKKLSDAFNPDAKFTAFSNVLQGVVGGFSGVTGAMALFGVKSDEVEKTLLKVQSAMALSQGINSVLEAKDSFIQLGAKIKDTAAFQKLYSTGTAIAATVTKAFGVSVETTSTGFKVLRGAIIATGIGALVIGITAAISAISDWISGTDDAAAAQDRLKTSIEETNDALRRQQSELKRNTNEAIARAKAEGKSEEEIFNIRREANKKNEVLLNQALNGKYEQLQKFKKFRDEDEESEAAYQNALKDYNESYQQFYDQQSQTRIDDFNEQARIREKNEAAEQAANERRKAALQKQLEERKKQAEEQRKLEEQLRENLRKIRATDVEEVEAYGAELLAAEQAITNQQLANKQFELEQKAKLAELDVLNNPNSVEAKIKKIQADLELELSAIAEGDLKRQILAKKAEDEILKIKQDAREQDKKQTALTEEDKLQIVSNALGQLADVVGKHTAAGKVLAIAQATIDTYSGATKALAQGGVFGFIGAAAVIAAGIANINKIINTKVPGSAGSSGPSISPISAQAPAAPLQPQVSSTRLLANQINQSGSAAQPQPVQAFVVDSQAGDARERATRLARAARLGG